MSDEILSHIPGQPEPKSSNKLDDMDNDPHGNRAVAEHFKNLEKLPPLFPPPPPPDALAQDSLISDESIDVPAPEEPPADPSLLIKEQLEKQRAEKMDLAWTRNTRKDGHPPIGGAQE